MKENLEHELLEFFSTYSYNDSALNEIKDLFEATKKNYFERTFLHRLEEDVNIYAKKSLGLDEDVVKLMDIKDLADSIRIRLENAEKQYKEIEEDLNKIEEDLEEDETKYLYYEYKGDIVCIPDWYFMECLPKNIWELENIAEYWKERNEEEGLSVFMHKRKQV